MVVLHHQHTNRLIHTATESRTTVFWQRRATSFFVLILRVESFRSRSNPFVRSCHLSIWRVRKTFRTCLRSLRKAPSQHRLKSTHWRLKCEVLLKILELYLVLLHPFWHHRAPPKLFENNLKQLCNYHCQMANTETILPQHRMSSDSSRWRLTILLQMLELYLVLPHPFCSKLFENHLKNDFPTSR